MPLPTSARSFYVAHLRWLGLSDEEIAECVDAYIDEDIKNGGSQYLMYQGGRAGVAQVFDGVEEVLLVFGTCEDVTKIYELAKDVYNFKVEESLCVN